MRAITPLPTVQGWRYGLIVTFRKLPIQHFMQIRLNRCGGLALGPHGAAFVQPYTHGSLILGAVFKN